MSKIYTNSIDFLFKMGIIKDGHPKGESTMKVDVKKEYRELFDASVKAIDMVEVPEFQFLMIDGIGNPTVPEFKLKSKALNIMAKAIRSYYKEREDMSYLISPLEGMWDTYDNAKFDVTRKKMIRYTLMMSQPKFLTPEVFEEVKKSIANKKGNPYIQEIYLKKFTEGKSVQMLHIGPYNTEIMTTKEIMEYIIVQNMKLNGMHHEIYLNNPEKVVPEKLKTIVRYAVCEI